MTAKLLRLGYVCEFLLAIVAIFTAWSEIGGEAALELMHWGWKFGFVVALALAIVGFTASLITQDAWFTLRSVRWLAGVMALVVAMGAITYYYSLEEDNGESDDQSTISRLRSPKFLQYPKVRSIRLS